jgi:hypothetical protein
LPIYLPSPVAIYFDPDNRGRIHILEDCFAKDATVVDEGRTYLGLDAVREWMRVSLARYDHTATPLSAVVDGMTCEVTARVTGKFPNGPITLHHVFALRDSRIAMLKIHR